MAHVSSLSASPTTAVAQSMKHRPNLRNSTAINPLSLLFFPSCHFLIGHSSLSEPESNAFSIPIFFRHTPKSRFTVCQFKTTFIDCRLKSHYLLSDHTCTQTVPSGPGWARLKSIPCNALGSSIKLMSGDSRPDNLRPSISPAPKPATSKENNTIDQAIYISSSTSTLGRKMSNLCQNL